MSESDAHFAEAAIRVFALRLRLTRSAQKRWNEALNISSGEKCYQDALDSLSFHITALQQRKSFLLLFASVLSLTLTIALAFYTYMHLLK